jgi:hypothetical protein
MMIKCWREEIPWGRRSALKKQRKGKLGFGRIK